MWKGDKSGGISDLARRLFGHFRDLNLLTLRSNLDVCRVARRDWFADGHLCPLGHGMPGWVAVRDAVASTQSRNEPLPAGLHRTHVDVGLFVDLWDKGLITRDWLVEQVEQLWMERLADADTLQAVVTAGTVAAKTVADPGMDRTGWEHLAFPEKQT